jgi:hypothetical protein
LDVLLKANIFVFLRQTKQSIKKSEVKEAFSEAKNPLFLHYHLRNEKKGDEDKQ